MVRRRGKGATCMLWAGICSTHDVCAACVRAKHDEAHAHALHVGYLQATCKALEHAQHTSIERLQPARARPRGCPAGCTASAAHLRNAFMHRDRLGAMWVGCAVMESSCTAHGMRDVTVTVHATAHLSGLLLGARWSADGGRPSAVGPWRARDGPPGHTPEE